MRNMNKRKKTESLPCWGGNVKSLQIGNVRIIRRRVTVSLSAQRNWGVVFPTDTVLGKKILRAEQQTPHSMWSISKSNPTRCV